MFEQMDFSIIFRKLLHPVFSFVGRVGSVLLVIFIAFVLYALFKYGINPFRARDPLVSKRLRSMRIRLKVLDFLRWKWVDYVNPMDPGEFREFGLTLFCGRQGAGKTISMVNYGWEIRKRYPNCIIVTNFACSFADTQMKSWRDFFEIRNGIDGVLFLIDEIHTEYSAADWKDFPEHLLAEISQQRKQRVKICATAQVFTRVVKQLREQCNSVVQCKTFLGRWTFTREYDAQDYEIFCDSAAKGEKLRAFSRKSFVQSDRLRNCYDTYEKIQRLEKVEFLARSERGAS